MRRRTLLAAAAAWLAACATRPPEPPKTRHLTGADVFAADPAVLRAAVLTDPRVIIQSAVIELRAPTLDERFVIRLQQPAAFDSRLAPAPPGHAWQVLALSADGAATLVTVRQMLTSRGLGPESVDVTVSAQPALVPAHLLAEMPLRIEALVDNREGWFTLFEGSLDLRR